MPTIITELISQLHAPQDAVAIAHLEHCAQQIAAWAGEAGQDASPAERVSLDARIRGANRHAEALAQVALSYHQPAQPALDVGPLALARWLEWLDRQPHALFAGMTGCGKSTMVKAAIQPRVEAGELVLVVDPHSSDWMGLESAGGGEDWDETEEALNAVYHEYKARLARRKHHLERTGRELPHDHFRRSTIVIDEVNLVRDAFERLYTGRERKLNPWTQFIECLGSGARKVGISVWLLAQSALVEDLGLSSSMRQNFTRIALDVATIRQMLKDEPLPERKRAITVQLPGLAYPATAMIQNEVYLLDRSLS